MYTTYYFRTSGEGIEGLKALNLKSGLIYRVRIDTHNLWSENAHTWCLENIGPCSWTDWIGADRKRLDDRASFIFYPEAKWSIIHQDFYFRHEEDAALFKMFCA